MFAFVLEILKKLKHFCASAQKNARKCQHFRACVLKKNPRKLEHFCTPVPKTARKCQHFRACVFKILGNSSIFVRLLQKNLGNVSIFVHTLRQILEFANILCLSLHAPCQTRRTKRKLQRKSSGRIIFVIITKKLPKK